nr:reverse transcriptase domain-containing protein [Tanacetum cinerariifolium]
MRTRRSYFPPTSTIPRRSRKQTTNVVEPEFYTIVEMADNRTMAQMLQAPIEGYEDVIVVPQINANNFELKQTLINLVQSNQFTGRQDPHNHLRFFNKVTSTFRHPEVPNKTIKHLLFPFSLEGEARIWLDKEPPRSILTWEDLQIATSLKDKLDIHMNRFEKSLNDMKNSFVTPTEPLKEVEECSKEVSEKQKMEDTMFELVKICQEKEFLCIYDDIDDLIESALDSKLLLINSNSQRLDKKEQEVKNVVEQPVERGNRNIQSLQNFRVVHKSSISFNTSQISSIHAIAPILSTKEPEHLLSMGYEHLSITPETESDKVTESNAENLLPILNKCEVTLEDEIECDMPANHDCSPIFTTFSNPLFNNDDLDFSDDESLPDEDVLAEDFKVYSNPLFDEDEINSDKLDPHCFNVESDFVESLLNRDTFIDFSSKFDFSGELAHVNLEIPKSNFDFEEEIHFIESLLYDNSFPRQPEELNAEIADTIIESIPSLPILVQDSNSQQEEIDIVTETDDVLPTSVENDDDLSNDPLLEEVDLFLFDNSIPPGIENFADDPEGDIRFLEELLIGNSILSHESFDSNFEENPSIPPPPPEPPDAQTDAGEETLVVINDEDVYYSFIFVIFANMFSLLSVEGEDTILDPGISD